MQRLIILFAALVSHAGAYAQCNETRLESASPAANDYLGMSVAATDSLVVAGAPIEDRGVLFNAGVVYVFERSGGAWSLPVELVPNDAAAHQQFGGAVAVDGDRIAVGASQHDALGLRTGAAYVFDRTGGVWSQTAQLFASNAAAQQEFGTSLALEGDTLVVGAPSDTSSGAVAGLVFVFERSGGAWNETSTLYPASANPGDRFGVSVALSGDTVLAGSRFGDTTAQDAGGAYLFRRAAGVWNELAELTAPGLETFDRFGTSVALSGSLAVVGAPAHDAGTAFVFEDTGAAWTLVQTLGSGEPGTGFGSAVAVDAGFVLVGSDAGSGALHEAAYLFAQTSAGWLPYAVLKRSMPFLASYGENVALAPPLVVVAAEDDDTSAWNAGAVFVYEPLTECFEPVPLGNRYCTPGNLNSAGGRGRVDASGRPHAVFNRLTLAATELPPNQFGYFLVGSDAAAIPGAGGSQGVLCLSGTIGRFVTQVQSSGPDGAFDIAVDLTALPTAPLHAVVAGETWRFQAWYRDQNPNQTSNFTDAIAVTFE
ncbi:MAG: hypothetical protein GY711_23035 [bacterium]|nr:hypothetical protein [bacterium]